MGGARVPTALPYPVEQAAGNRSLMLPVGVNTGSGPGRSIRRVRQARAQKEDNTDHGKQHGAAVSTPLRMRCVTHRLANPGSRVWRDSSQLGTLTWLMVFRAAS